MRPERNMDDFRAVLDDTDLIDLGYVDNGICGKEVSFLRIISMSALIEGFQGWLGSCALGSKEKMFSIRGLLVVGRIV
ncbi:hypothetical protein V6Z12_A01G176600 [Gossypium hirsutum]